jgi:uncharacterized protein
MIPSPSKGTNFGHNEGIERYCDPAPQATPARFLAAPPWSTTARIDGSHLEVQQAPGHGVHGMALTAQEIKHLLKLEPHSTCGFVAETYRSTLRIPQLELPAGYAGDRPFGSALYFLVTPDVRMRLHSNRSDQLYQHHMGGPLEVLLLYRSGQGEVRAVGTDLEAGMRPELFIPGGTFHVSRLSAGASWALLSATAWPGVEPPDIEQGDPAKQMVAYPHLRAAIDAFTRY